MALVYYFLFFLFKPLLAAFGLGETVNAESQLPTHLVAGETAVATWTIYKGDVRGFARLHLHTPKHMEVRPIQTAGATFEYDGEFVKLIWLDAPVTNSFEIELEIQAKPQFKGGRFEPLWSFIENGQRKDVAFSADYVGASASLVASAPLLPAPKSWEIPGDRPTDFNALPHYYDPKRFAIGRTIVIEGPDVARVEFHITGHPKGRFLRVVETLPESCSAEHDRSEKSTVQKTSEELTFQWYNAPKENDFVVSYRIMGDLAQCLSALHATAEFAVGEETRLVEAPGFDDSTLLDPDGWVLKNDALSQETEAAEPKHSEDPKPETIEVPAPDFGISYRVQVMAAHRHVNQKWFDKQFEFTDPIDVEPHEDWIKYTTGSFDHYEDARDRREVLSARFNFPGPFVTAYEQGERITVQEALVLAQQQWIP